jgi:hypothetical protein
VGVSRPNLVGSLGVENSDGKLQNVVTNSIAEGLDTFRHTKLAMIDPNVSVQDFWWFPYKDEEAFPGK